MLICIDEDSEVSLSTRTYWGGDGVPMREWHRRDLAYTVMPNADAATLRAELGEDGRLARLIDRIIAGHTTEWDGSNMVGKLTADAADADERLEERLYDYPTYDGQVASAEIWLTGGQQSLAECVEPDDTAEGLLEAAEGDGWIITDGIEGMRACVEQAAVERAEAA